MIPQLARTGRASRRTLQRALDSDTIPARAWESRMHYSTSPLGVLGHLLNTRFRDLDSFIEHAARWHGMATCQVTELNPARGSSGRCAES